MKWTKKKPSEPGWYWRKGSVAAIVEVVQIVRRSEWKNGHPELAKYPDCQLWMLQVEIDDPFPLTLDNESVWSERLLPPAIQIDLAKTLNEMAVVPKRHLDHYILIDREDKSVFLFDLRRRVFGTDDAPEIILDRDPATKEVLIRCGLIVLRYDQDDLCWRHK